MLFNSIEFAIFLPVVFLIYWFVVNKNLQLQNIFLLAASYFFYGWWDYRFLVLILFSSIVDFYIAKKIATESRNSQRKTLLFLSLFLNLGFLFYFKYYNFFLDSFVQSFTFFGHSFDARRLDVILPVGISFYTFQTLSYSIDVYRRKLEPAKDLVSFLTYVSFFPQLVAGPIERAVNLLPQFYRKRTFNYFQATDGLRQILWGLFKKMVIADNCSMYVIHIFDDYGVYSASTTLLGCVLFAIQIYCDFSGYSDVAIGTARLFGFDLKRNFAFPYFSRDIAEFWRRWHISLSTWFRDYLYIPLGGSKGSLGKKVRNIFIIFIVSGFWHGANWTYITWGALNAVFFLPLLLLNKNRSYLGVVAEGRILPNFTELMQMLTTFAITCLAWIFFRASSVEKAAEIISQLPNKTLFTLPQSFSDTNLPLYAVSIALLFTLEWIQRNSEHGLNFADPEYLKPLKRFFYIFLALFIIYYSGEQKQFTYFQF
jgi:D-alanyl-lipoteichoic acid acyltransferase DltB (MBOAT superfamily)